MRLVQLVCVIMIGLFLLTPATFAEEISTRTGFWGGIDVGVGLLDQSVDEIDDDETALFLGFKAGYTINPHFRMGLELSGWLLEEGNLEDPRVGEGISQIFLIARYYPGQRSNLFAKAGGGYVSIWNNRPGESRRKSGWGFTAGVGYDFLLDKKVALSPFVTYSFGDADEIDYRAINFGIGILFQ